jgi:tetratricopeptide (TPR) repeat protein
VTHRGVIMGNEYKQFLEATANSTCTCASEFNNRAVALMELGRYIEAQRDFDRACGLEPDASCLLNAAELYLVLGMKEQALENIDKARQLAGNGNVAYLHGLYYVARMFLKCNEPESAEEAFLTFLRFLQSIIPYTVKDDRGDCIIRKDGHTIHITPNIVDFEDLDRLVGAIKEARGRESIESETEELLDKIKVDISYINGSTVTKRLF